MNKEPSGTAVQRPEGCVFMRGPCLETWLVIGNISKQERNPTTSHAERRSPNEQATFWYNAVQRPEGCVFLGGPCLETWLI